MSITILVVLAGIAMTVTRRIKEQAKVPAHRSTILQPGVIVPGMAVLKRTLFAMPWDDSSTPAELVRL